MHKTALVGFGYWGTNIFRNLVTIVGINNVIVVDADVNKINKIKKSFPNLVYYLDYKIIAKNPDVKNVIIATPTNTHFDLSYYFLKAKKNVLVEKPTTTSLRDALKLKKVADKYSLVLMTDYTFLYNPVVNKIKELFTKEYIGKVNYIDSTRINLGVYQKDTNVLWDLACHDVSIINYLVEEKPSHVRAIGRMNNEHKIEDISYIFFYYPSGMLVQISSSWASPVKIRKMIIGAEKKMIIFDDIDPSNKLIIYEYQNLSSLKESKSELADYRLGNTFSPKISNEEPLYLVINDFIKSTFNNTVPKIKFEETINIIKFLEKANESLKQNGKLVKL
jgi:predicted dehydrogenase